MCLKNGPIHLLRVTKIVLSVTFISIFVKIKQATLLHGTKDGKILQVCEVGKFQFFGFDGRVHNTFLRSRHIRTSVTAKMNLWSILVLSIIATSFRIKII